MSSDVDLSLNNSEARTPETSTDSAKIPDEIDAGKNVSVEISSPKKDKTVKRKLEEHQSSAKKFKFSMDKIVSPVVPQPGAWLKRTSGVNKKPKHNRTASVEVPQFREKNKQFQYGNYNR